MDNLSIIHLVITLDINFFFFFCDIQLIYNSTQLMIKFAEIIKMYLLF